MEKNIKKFGMWTLLGISVITGYFACQQSCKNNSLKKEQERLEIMVESNSIRYTNLLTSSEKKDERLNNYEDSILALLNLNRGVEFKNKELEGFKEKYFSLTKQFELIKKESAEGIAKGEKYDSLMNELQLVLQKYAELKETNNGLKTKYDELLALYNTEISKKPDDRTHYRYQEHDHDKGISYETKHKDAFLEPNRPRFISIGQKSITFKDDAPENSEAWTQFTKTKREVPLKVIEYQSKQAIFAYPDFGNYEGPFEVWMVDKDKNKSRVKTLYVYNNVVYTHEKLVRKKK